MSKDFSVDESTPHFTVVTAAVSDDMSQFNAFISAEIAAGSRLVNIETIPAALGMERIAYFTKRSHVEFRD